MIPTSDITIWQKSSSADLKAERDRDIRFQPK